jgi:hypothetical protein
VRRGVPALQVENRTHAALAETSEYAASRQAIGPDRAADCERALQTTQDPEWRFVLIKLRDQWIAVGNERSLMTDDEIANDIERLGRIQSELIDRVSSTWAGGYRKHSSGPH